LDSVLEIFVHGPPFRTMTFLPKIGPGKVRES
jgi:hypothetical protein